MKHSAEFSFRGETLIADADGALYWPAVGVLVVADLHLEKGSAYGAAGTFLPPYDSRTTLERLADAVTRYAPATVICLGDSFHDRDAGVRMTGEDRERLTHLASARDWVWITGNHDPTPPEGIGGIVRESCDLGPYVFRHETAPDIVRGEISGHFHPKALVRVRGRTLSCRCFVTDGKRLILPAFGAYAGGLNVLDPAIARYFGRNLAVYALRRGAVHAVGRRSLVGEPGPQAESF